MNMAKYQFFIAQFFGLIYFTLGLSLIPKMSDLNRELHFDRFDGICERKQLPITIKYTIIKIEKRVITFNITLNAKEDIAGKPYITMRVSRCLTKDNLDTCEDFLTQTGQDYCSMIDPVAGRFSPWQINYQPPYKCPIKKGTYYAYNSRLDTLAAMVVPLENWYWKARLELFDEKTNRKLECTQIEAHLITSHQKQGH